MTFIEFTATSTTLKVIIDNASQPTLVRFLLSDGVTTVDKATPTDITGTLYTYESAGDYSDGIYSCTVNPGEGDETTAFISNILNGLNCLLKKVLKKDYDCRLAQELEAVKQYTFLQEESFARAVYIEVGLRCAECETTYVDGLSGISIWIINNDFIVQ